MKLERNAELGLAVLRIAVGIVFTLLAANTGLALAGPGALAIDNRVRRSSAENAKLSRVA